MILFPFFQGKSKQQNSNNVCMFPKQSLVDVEKRVNTDLAQEKTFKTRILFSFKKGRVRN